MNKFIAIAIAISGFVLNGVAEEQRNPCGLTDADGREIMSLIHSNHLAQTSLAYKSAVAPRMLEEANWLSERLKLPPPHPIQPFDVKRIYVIAPWYSGLDRAFLNTNIPSPIARVLAAKVAIRGFIETTNFNFGFDWGKLVHVCRMEGGKNYIDDDKLDKWVKMPSLIDESQAYQLATEWLTAIDVDMAALAKLKWTVHPLRYLPSGATNPVVMPFYYVDFGSRHLHSENMDSDEPLIEIKILGVTKELMELSIADETLSHRSQIIITNAMELSRIPDPSPMPLQHLPATQTNH
jgi:hypothetical protein